MLRFASIALIPVLAATFFSHDGALKQSSSSPAAHEAPAEWREQDRTFLNTLNQEEKESALVSRIAARAADQEFLVSLQEEELIPVRRAIPVDRSIPDDPWADAVREGHEVRRAIPVDEPTVITRTAVNPPTSLASDTDRRNALQQSFVSLDGKEPEVRRAIPVNRQRPSISIYGEQVIVRMNTASSR